MADIVKFEFKKEKFNAIRNYHFGENWPIVYMIENGQEAYVGETVNAYVRSLQHYEKPERRKLSAIHIIADEEYNKSATLDIESNLIQYLSADGRFILQNGNGGLKNHNYYDKEKYQAKFEVVWKDLKERGLVLHNIEQIRNSDLFKYSPYKVLTSEQMEIANKLLAAIKSKKNQAFLINGDPGTGKTILAAYLFKRLKEVKETKDMKIGLVVPMGGLRNTMKKIFKNIKGLKANMVIGPSDVLKKYDILIVDEAHRLKQRRNIVNFKSFDDNNRALGLGVYGTELDWITKSSDVQILFYDKNQSVMPSDVSPFKFKELDVVKFELKNQMRVGLGDGGENYLRFIQEVFDVMYITQIDHFNYDFKVYDNLSEMVDAIKEKDQKFDLCRLVSGYSWQWNSRNNPDKYDIEIGDVKLKWNSVIHNWPYSPNAINEVGCIHTVQGYDLNYVGVIIGPEISYDLIKKQFVIKPENYKDMNGKRGIDDKKELERYIINIYKTLLVRGIHGTYIYIVDDNLRQYFKESFSGLIK